MVKDLTQGKPSEVLIRFTLPMFISVIFQQLYNMADSIIAGKFAGESALAAVGSSYPVTMILMAVALGCNMGCSVVISQLFGAKKIRELKSAISTTLISSVVISLILTVLGLIFCKPLMMLVKTPDDIFSDGSLYLRIYIGGFTFLFLYNIATGIFNSLGDSNTPLYFLIGSSLGNIFLDILLVTRFNMGVAGVAWATFIAQGIACILSVIVLLKRITALKCEKYELFSFPLLLKISEIAIPSVLQQSFVSVGNVFIQRYVNGFGSSVIAGYSAAIKLNTFALTCFHTVANAYSSFAAQNFGAGKISRIKKAFKSAFIIDALICVPFVVLFVFFSHFSMELFLESDESVKAINTGIRFLRIVSPFYFLIIVKLLCDGVLRGTGSVSLFMISTFTDLIIRVILAYILKFPFDETGIWLSWPFGWLLGSLLSLVFYLKGNWAEKLGDITEENYE